MAINAKITQRIDNTSVDGGHELTIPGTDVAGANVVLGTSSSLLHVNTNLCVTSSSTWHIVFSDNPGRTNVTFSITVASPCLNILFLSVNLQMHSLSGITREQLFETSILI